jgi:hypothetical protein
MSLMLIESLWTDDHEAACDRARQAIVHDDLTGALLAVEGAAAGVCHTTRETLDGWIENLDRFPLHGAPEIQAAVLRRVLSGG